ncbi:MAG: class I SAM-dependent methyltransferase, partial [Pseudomonadota bacterium]
RFAANRARAAEVMDERFCRMWELYLSVCENAFLEGPSNVVQLQLGRERDAAPLTRDYLAEETARLKAAEAGFVERVAASAAEALDA